MTARGADNAQPAVDLAINRVLAAEQAARAAIEACRAAAEDQVTAANARAQAIGASAERRVRQAHAIADRGIEQALADLSAAGSGDEPAPTPDPARLQAVVAALAAELSGGAR